MTPADSVESNLLSSCVTLKNTSGNEHAITLLPGFSPYPVTVVVRIQKLERRFGRHRLRQNRAWQGFRIDPANRRDAQPGTPIYQGSTLTTGSDGSLGITLKDNTVMSFGPDTEVSIDDYLYKPAQDRLKLVARIAKGTLHYLSGIIAKLKPEAVSINTPTGIIGVRGTRFAVKVED